MAPPRKPSISELSESFGQTTTLHGVRGVLDTSYRKCHRIVWFALVVAGLAMYITLAYQSIAMYLNYESVTKVSTTSAESLEFPAVTICDSNSASQTTMQSFGLTVTYCFAKGILDDGVAANDSCIPVLQNVSLIDLLITRRDHMFDEMFIMCSFNQVVIPCKEYFTVLMIENSACYTFMSAKLVKEKGHLFQTAAGFSYGLNILIDTKVDDYYLSYKDGQGMNVLVHDHRYFPSVDEESFAVQPGIEAYVAIEKSVRKTLGEPYSEVPCQEDTNWIYHSDYITLKGYNEYSYGGCRYDCLYQYSIVTCECDLGIPQRECSLYAYTNCIRQRVRDFYKHHVSACTCYKLCTQSKYKYQISKLSYPTEFAVDMLHHMNVSQKSFEYLSKNMISLYVYFQSISYDTVEQVPSKTGSDIIADIGGQMGLFLGASLITVFEILQFICLLIVKRFTKGNKTHPLQNFNRD